jgi:hypothetical protein
MTMKRIFWLTLSGLLLAGGVLYVVMDHAACVDTEAVVLRNWHDYGWWSLRAGYVVNEGGIQAGEPVRILHGHLSTVLWPYHLLHLLTGDLAMSYGLAFLAFIACLWGAFWFAYPNKRLAVWWSLALVCSPAFLRSYLDVDPVSHGLLYCTLAFPVALRWLMAPSEPNRLQTIWLSLLLLVVLSLDWPNAMSLAIWSPMFLLLERDRWSWRRAFQWLFPLGLFSAALMVAMILHKQQGNVSLAFLLKHYAVGADAHVENLGVSWLVAIKRHVMASGIGWLPLWGVWCIMVCQTRRLEYRRLGLCLLPVLGSLLLLLVLKDYFADHQWLVAPLVANGLTASVWGLCQQRDLTVATEVVPVQWRGWIWAVPLLLMYALFFALFFRMNNADKAQTHAMISHYTPRQAVVLMYPYDYKRDGKTLEVAKRARMEFDRQVEPYVPGQVAVQSARGRPCFVLARTNLPGGMLVAQVTNQTGFMAGMTSRILDFYRNKISQRRKGDTSEWSGWNYLYQEPVLLKEKTP